MSNDHHFRTDQPTGYVPMTFSKNLLQTLNEAMEAISDYGPIVSLHPTVESFQVSDTGQRSPVIAWTPLFVWTRSTEFGAVQWQPTPRNPMPSFSQLLRAGYT